MQENKNTDYSEKSSNYNGYGKKDLSQKLLQGYGLALLQLPFWLQAFFDLSENACSFFSENYVYYLVGGFGVLGVDLFRKIQSLKTQKKESP